MNTIDECCSGLEPAQSQLNHLRQQAEQKAQWQRDYEDLVARSGWVKITPEETERMTREATTSNMHYWRETSLRPVLVRERNGLRLAIGGLRVFGPPPLGSGRIEWYALGHTGDWEIEYHLPIPAIPEK